MCKSKDCKNCSCAVLKFDQGSAKDIMYCLHKGNLIMLRMGWGSRPAPDWCPMKRRRAKEA